MSCSCDHSTQTSPPRCSHPEEWGQKYFIIFLPKYYNFFTNKIIMTKGLPLILQVSSAFLHCTLVREVSQKIFNHGFLCKKNGDGPTDNVGSSYG